MLTLSLRRLDYTKGYLLYKTALDAVTKTLTSTLSILLSEFLVSLGNSTSPGALGFF
jgi:hypothetical protein